MWSAELPRAKVRKLPVSTSADCDPPIPAVLRGGAVHAGRSRALGSAWRSVAEQGGVPDPLDQIDLGKDGGRAVCATAKALGKPLGLLRYSELDRY